MGLPKSDRTHQMIYDILKTYLEKNKVIKCVDGSYKKICDSCNKTLFLNHETFYCDRTAEGVLGFTTCKECVKEEIDPDPRNVKQQKCSDSSLLLQGLKRCTGCRNVQKLTNFHQNKQYSDNLNIYCRSCKSERRKKQNMKKKISS